MSLLAAVTVMCRVWRRHPCEHRSNYIYTANGGVRVQEENRSRIWSSCRWQNWFMFPAV